MASKTDEALALIKDFANHKGYVKNLDSDSLREKLHLTKHDVNKILYDLKSRGLLGFSEKSAKGRDGAIFIYRFRLTKKGMNGVKPMEDTYQGENFDSIELDEEPAVNVLDEPVPPAEATAVQVPTLAELREREAAQRPEIEPQGDRYPNLVRLLDRKRLAEQAAANLEALGADNLALQALELAEAPLTPLQRDIVEFFVDHKEFVRFALEKEQ